MTIFGWDASDYDWDRGPMDLGAARRDGIDFFTYKSTENTNFKHKHFGEAVARARDAGIPFIGAYHVVRSPGNAGAEVAYCLNYVNSVAPWWRDFSGWFWQVDLERWPYDAVPASEGESFADIIEAQTGRKAVIYASKGQYGDSLSGTSHELWNANYGNNPVGHYRSLYPGDGSARWGAYSGRVPKILQYGSQCRIGTQNNCDANAFRGTVGDFAAMIGASSNSDLLANIQEEEYMISDVLYTGFAFDESGNYLNGGAGVQHIPLFPVGGSASHAKAWVFAAGGAPTGSGGPRLRVGVHNSGTGAWTWSDLDTSFSGGQVSIGLPSGTDALKIGRKRKTSGDLEDQGYARWTVGYSE